MRSVAERLTLLDRSSFNAPLQQKRLTLKRASFFFEPSLNLEQTDSQLREGLPLIGQNFGN